MSASKTRAAIVLALVAAIGSTAEAGAQAAGGDRGHGASAGQDAAEENVKKARREGKYSFCTSPRRPLGLRQSGLCALANEVEGCEAFAKQCALGDKPNLAPKSALFSALGSLAQVLIWVLVILIALAIAVPIARAIVRARRDRRVQDAREPAKSHAVPLAAPPPDPSEISDAEAALREADDLARRGELARALGLYLAASLAALDRRGAIRLARHRTNGEYVRFCSDTTARQPLREIVREVDRVDYGKMEPSREGVAAVAARAAALVRAVAVASLVVLVLAGCGGVGDRLAGGHDDPAGDELPIDVLRRGGYPVAYLTTSIATMPMPTGDGARPLLVIDLEHVPLEDESQAHLLRWVEAGGTLLLMGPPREWPHELGVKHAAATTRDLTLVDLEESIDESQTPMRPRDESTPARVAGAQAIAWPSAVVVAKLGDRVYAARKEVGAGTVLGVANDDLFTNLGVARPANAAALVALVEAATRSADVMRAARPVTIAVARAEDGIPPPNNPFAALLRAGLGKWSWHALAASIVLFLAYGIRRARARPVAPKARRAFAEHVEATGAFYGRARAYGHALAAYGRFAELRLRERVPRGSDPAAFLAARADVALLEAKKVYERAVTAKAGDEIRGDELATIKELRAMLAKALGAT